MVPSFRLIERNFSQLRDGKRGLAARDVQAIFDPQLTPFAKFWAPPNEKELDRALRGRNLKLGPLQEENPYVLRSTVRDLMALLHSMGIASLVLRFVHPKVYGVFSTPVIDLLRIQRASTLDLYLDYCNELKDWQQNFHLNSVADTEMALWAFAQSVRATQTAEEAKRSRKAFDEDTWVQRRRVKQAILPFLEHFGPLSLAMILVEAEPNLAAMIAGREFERRMKSAAQKFVPFIDLKRDGWLYEVVTELKNRKRLTAQDALELLGVWVKRNIAVHADRTMDDQEVQSMIEKIRDICKWDCATRKDGKVNVR
jgi:hypothetical protein